MLGPSLSDLHDPVLVFDIGHLQLVLTVVCLFFMASTTFSTCFTSILGTYSSGRPPFLEAQASRVMTFTGRLPLPFPLPPFPGPP